MALMGQLGDLSIDLLTKAAAGLLAEGYVRFLEVDQKCLSLNSASEIAIAEPRRQSDRSGPDAGDHHGCGSAHWAFPCESGGSSVLCHDLWRDHFNHGQNAERQDYQIIEIPQHRNEIGDQIDWR